MFTTWNKIMRGNTDWLGTVLRANARQRAIDRKREAMEQRKRVPIVDFREWDRLEQQMKLKRKEA